MREIIGWFASRMGCKQCLFMTSKLTKLLRAWMSQSVTCMTRCVTFWPSDRAWCIDWELARHARVGSLLRTFAVHGIFISRIKPNVADIVVGNGEVPSGERIFRGSYRLHFTLVYRLNACCSFLRRTAERRMHIPARLIPITTSTLEHCPLKAPSLASRHSSTVRFSPHLVPRAN